MNVDDTVKLLAIIHEGLSIVRMIKYVGMIHDSDNKIKNEIKNGISILTLSLC